MTGIRLLFYSLVVVVATFGVSGKALASQAPLLGNVAVCSADAGRPGVDGLAGSDLPKIDPSKLDPLFGAKPKAKTYCPSGYLVDDECTLCTFYCNQAGCENIECQFWGWGDQGETWFWCNCM